MHPRLLLVALKLLTRLPVGDPWREERDAARSVAWHGLTGAVVGGVAASTWWLSTLALSRSASAAVAVAVTVALTGGMHEDGAADSADGLFGGRDPDRRLAIMRDSTLGTYGVLALVLVVVLKVTLLASLAPVQGAVALVAAAALSRGTAGLAMLGAVSAAEDDSDAVLLEHLRPAPAAVAAVSSALIALLLLGPVGLAVTAVAVAVAFVVRGMAVRRLGGLTGDVTGAMILLAELAALTAVAALDADAVLWPLDVG